MVFNRLLVPLDGSRLAESVLPMVQRIALACSASVTLMHIRESNPPETIHGEHHLSDPAEAEAYLKRIATSLREKGIPTEWHVHEALEGDVAASVLQHADEFQPDLLALCTHGSGGFRDLLYGSIAQQVLQHGRWPVLVVQPGRAGQAPEDEIQRIVVPIDGTERHPAPTEMASQLARALNAELHLIMVVPTRETLAGDRSVIRRTMPSTVTAILELDEQDAVRYLREAASGCTIHGVQPVAHVLRGDAVEEVARYAGEVRADLVIVATHGRAGIGAFFAGSFGAGIMDKITMPILLVPRHSEAPTDR